MLIFYECLASSLRHISVSPISREMMPTLYHGFRNNGVLLHEKYMALIVERKGEWFILLSSMFTGNRRTYGNASDMEGMVGSI